MTRRRQRPVGSASVTSLEAAQAWCDAVLSGRIDQAWRVTESADRRAIAERLGIGERTVKAHQDSAMLKTGTHSVAGLVRYALRNGLVVP